MSCTDIRRSAISAPILNCGLEFFSPEALVLFDCGWALSVESECITGGESLKGVCKRWLDGRGYGFILPEGSEDDLFVHYSGLISVHDLKENQEVEFEIEDTPKGPRAIHVKVV